LKIAVLSALPAVAVMIFSNGRSANSVPATNLFRLSTYRL
jgi:hypothetical protein